MRRRSAVAVLARLTAGLLAQNPLILWRTDALLVLVTRSSILAQEHLLVANVSCEQRQRRGRKSSRGRSSGMDGERRKCRGKENRREELGIKSVQQSDRMTGCKRIVGE